MAYFTNKRTSKQRAIGYAFVPFCLAYVLWLVWPIISLISFWVKNGLVGGFDWSILWKMYLLAYPIGFVLLLGIKTLAGGRIGLHRFYNLDGVFWMVFLYPIFTISEMYTFVTCDTDFAETLGLLLQAIIKGGVIYLICAFPSSVLFGTVSFKDWFEDVPLMLMFAGIILLIWVFDVLWFWEATGTVALTAKNAIYYLLALGAIGLTVYGCMTVLGNLYTDYFDIATQLTPLCLPLTLLVFYTLYLGWDHNDASRSYITHILPLLVSLGLTFLGAYLIGITKILFFVLLGVLFGVVVLLLVRAKGMPCGKYGTSEKHKRALASALALGGGGSSGGGGITNAPVNQSLPEDKGCEKLRSRLKGNCSYPNSYEKYGIAFTCRVSLSTCSQGRVVWEVSTTVTKREIPSGPNDWQHKQWQEEYLKEKKEELRDTLTREAQSAIRDLANHYRTYGGSWSVTVRI